MINFPIHENSNFLQEQKARIKERNKMLSPQGSNCVRIVHLSHNDEYH